RPIFAAFIALGIASGAHAVPRAFQVNSDVKSEEGYAIAWGIPGEKIDFDKIASNEKRTDEFINKHIDHIHNFVVDLKTKKILLDLGEDANFSLGTVRIGNSSSLSLKKVSIDGLLPHQEALAVFEGYRWTNSVRHILIIDRKKGAVVKVDAVDVNEKIAREIEKNLPKDHQASFDRGAHFLTLEKAGDVVNVEINSHAPKKEESVRVNAKVKLTLNNDVIDVHVLSAQNQE
ncbi:MAG TPA: hypothetical protein VN132_04530, partial [Bdellovibrio sp.]|nr:hypothetical protein [Bdellovibrio sp.]